MPAYSADCRLRSRGGSDLQGQAKCLFDGRFLVPDIPEFQLGIGIRVGGEAQQAVRSLLFYAEVDIADQPQVGAVQPLGETQKRGEAADHLLIVTAQRLKMRMALLG